MALVSTSQSDFSAGMYRDRKALPGSVYDLRNALIDDQGLIYRRGGSEYYSTSDASSSLYRLHALYMRAPAANRILMRRTGSTDVQVLNGSLAPVALPGDSQWSRPASVGDYAIFAVGGKQTLYYGGSQKVAYNTGTVSITQGTTTLTGVGTTWTTNVDAGMVLKIGTGYGVVQSVTNNTTLELLSPWAYTTAAGSAYNLGGVQVLNITAIPLAFANLRGFVVGAGAGTPRLLFCVGNRVYFTPRGDPFTFAATDYHELPANAVIVGAEGRGDSALIFTTAGVYSVGNLSFDAIDAFGNIQHTVELVNKDVILWDDYGIAGFAGGLVIPCIDDVLLMTADGFTALSARIRPLYRGHAQAGYQLGQAAVYRGHLFLPIMDGTSVVETLVCRLDRDAAWSRWNGGAAAAAHAVLIEEPEREPKLLGVAGARVIDLTGTLTPSNSNATDADGTVADLTLTTNDMPTGANQPGFVQKLRARYELVDDGSGGTAAPTVTPSFTSDQDADFFTVLTEKGEQGGGAGWGVSDGSKFQWVLVGKRRERVRFGLTVAGASASFVLRSIEMLSRPSGKQ